LRLSRLTVWGLALAIGTFVAGGPYLYYRYSYTYGKRLRPVVEARVYRSGCMTADGFAEAIDTRHIRTVFNLMEEFPDPILSQGYFDLTPIREAEVCERHGAKMVNLTVDLIAPNRIRKDRPAAIKTFLERMDDPASYPVLIHCKAGLHRTGIMVAVYRMEYCHWTALEALGELKANGFGNFAATAANDYITQYILTYEPRQFTSVLPPGRADFIALPKAAAH
jgi:tyrosine-protein phosphatase SIW14